MNEKFKQELRLVVTQSDWDKALKAMESPNALRGNVCPVSQAIGRRFPGCKVVTGLVSSIVRCGDETTQYHIGKANDIVNSFDAEMPISLPRTFIMRRLV